MIDAPFLLVAAGVVSGSGEIPLTEPTSKALNPSVIGAPQVEAVSDERFGIRTRVRGRGSQSPRVDAARVRAF